MQKTELGLILYTLRDYLKTPDDIARTLARVKEIGYGTVELASVGPIKNSELARLLKENELEAVSAHIGWDGLCNEIQKLIDQHLELGCKHVVISSMPGEFRSAEGYQRFAKLATERAMALSEHGITFGYHNHSFEFEHFDGKPGQALLRENGDPKYFNFEIDTYWVQHGGADPAAWISKVGGSVPTVHMKDMVIRDGKQAFAEVGQGNLNWDAILKASKKAGVKYYIVEQDVCYRDPFDSVATSLKNMKSWGLS